jgi:hypothetical protein
MSEAIVASEFSETEILNTDVSDEALETAACAGPESAKAFTVSMCTGQTTCPF